MMSGHLAAKRGLIVAGTAGIGGAAAARFLAEGARVVVAGRSEDEGVAAKVALQDLGPVLHVTMDATRSGQVEALFGTARDFLAGLDVLYHVAGISGRRQGDGALHE